MKRVSSAVAGVDVGGRRKGFDVAVLSQRRARLHRTLEVEEVAALVRGVGLVGVDAPASWAPAGELSRPDERAFVRAGICGIRFTPDETTARARTDDHLGWVWNGLALYGALAAAGIPSVEVFPTAAWTRWLGPREGRTRLAWTREGWRRLLDSGLTVDGDAERPTQDAMDAVAAALVADQARSGRVDRFGDLVAPARGSWPLSD